MTQTYESGYYTRVAAKRASGWVRFTAFFGAVPVCAATVLLGPQLPDPVTGVGVVLVAVGALCYLIGIIGGAFSTIIWLTRARDVCDAYYPYEHKFKAGWTVGGWFLNYSAYVIPYLVTTDVIQATELARPGARGPLKSTTKLWWGTWLASHFLLGGAIAAQILLHKAPAWVGVLVGLVVAALAIADYVIAARSLSTIVTSVARWQDEDIHARYQAAHAPRPDDTAWRRPTA